MKLFAISLKRKPNVQEGAKEHRVGFEKAETAEKAVAKVIEGNVVELLVKDVCLDHYDIVALELKTRG